MIAVDRGPQHDSSRSRTRSRLSVETGECSYFLRMRLTCEAMSIGPRWRWVCHCVCVLCNEGCDLCLCMYCESMICVCGVRVFI